MGPTNARSYRILEVLGTGGFGTVYRAEMSTSAGLVREVALKVLRPDAASEESTKRLRDEARMLSALQCAGIVRVDDLMQLDGRWTMVMELVDGVDLDVLIEAHGALPARVALGVIQSSASALWQVYTAQGPSGAPLSLLHRDVKPANLLLCRDGRVKMLDFGVARAELEEREAMTQAAIVMGSLPYLAPERYTFDDSHAGDVYALGCVLFELLMGRRFGRTRAREEGHVAKLREGLHALWDPTPEGYREELLGLLGQCMAYDADMRPTADELAQRAAEIERKLPGPTMAQWARAHVPPLLDQRSAEPDALVGQVLTEHPLEETVDGPRDQVFEAPPETPPVPPELPRSPTEEREAGDRRRVSAAPPLLDVPTTPMESPGGPPKWVVGLGVLAAVGLIGGLVAMAWMGRPDPTPTPEPLPPPTVDTGGIIFQPLPPDPEPDPEPEPEPVRPRPKPRPEPPVLEPEAPQGPLATVRVGGDAVAIRLVSSEGSFSAGPVPPGTYTLFPEFEGGYVRKGPSVSLADGDVVTFVCTSESQTCARE